MAVRARRGQPQPGSSRERDWLLAVASSSFEAGHLLLKTKPSCIMHPQSQICRKVFVYPQSRIFHAFAINHWRKCLHSELAYEGFPERSTSHPGGQAPDRLSLRQSRLLPAGAAVLTSQGPHFPLFPSIVVPRNSLHRHVVSPTVLTPLLYFLTPLKPSPHPPACLILFFLSFLGKKIN